MVLDLGIAEREEAHRRGGLGLKARSRVETRRQDGEKKKEKREHGHTIQRDERLVLTAYCIHRAMHKRLVRGACRTGVDASMVDGGLSWFALGVGARQI